MIDLLIALASVAAGQTTDPLAPAREGKLQCIVPNTEKKTCMGLATYTMRADGSYDSVTTTALAPTPLITMETRISGKIENGQVCNTIRTADLTGSDFKMDGAPMDPAMAEGIKAQIVAAVGAMDGKKACSTESADGDVRVAAITVDGVRHPELDQRFIWVGPADGYKVGQ